LTSFTAYSQLFKALGQRLIEIAVDLYKYHDIGLGLKELLYAMDSTTIDLCLKVFPRADLLGVSPSSPSYNERWA
jgi:hypothetical protein